MKKLIIPLALILGACENSSTFQANGSRSMSESITAHDMAVTQESGRDLVSIPAFKTASTSSSAPIPPNQQSNDNPTNLNFLAYRYNYGFRLPARAVAATSKSHAQMCLDAGPKNCQVLNSSTSAFNEDNVIKLSEFSTGMLLLFFPLGTRSVLDGVSLELNSRSISLFNLTFLYNFTSSFLIDKIFSKCCLTVESSSFDFFN